MSAGRAGSDTKGSATEREIRSQPALWASCAGDIRQQAADIQSWIGARKPAEIWLCGAGTSAYIGETLCDYLEARSGIRCRALATTSLVSAPQDLLEPARRVLVVSFGRSGNSPETLGVLDLIDRHMPRADRLNITCNSDSALANRPASAAGEQRTIILPEAAHDQGFAMTASFTTMMLTALACLDRVDPPRIKERFTALAEQAAALIPAAEALADGRFSKAPERVVFLGTGPLTGIARESGLKVLELTGGKVATAWESSLGFRHGPKAFMNSGTLVFANLSSDPHTRQYDRDLVLEIRRQYGADRVFTIGVAGSGADVDFASVANDAWNAVLHVLLPQVLAVRWSRALDLAVDNPFAGGELNRVVSGVTLYPYNRGDNVRRD